MENVIRYFKFWTNIASRDKVSGRAGETATSHRSPADSGVSLSVDSARVATVLLVLAASIWIASIALTIVVPALGFDSVLLAKLSKAVDVDRERNIPAFLSMLNLLLAATLLGMITFLKQMQRAAYRGHWACLAFGFLYMAFDEIAEIHEKIIDPMRVVLGGDNLGAFYFAWVVPGIALVVVLAVVFLRFWWNLPVRTRLQFLIAGAIFLSGAIGVELLNGKYAEIYGKADPWYKMLSTIEEVLEMVGVIAFVKALIDYLATEYRKLEISPTPR
ncbi:MAG: hypothetical protein ACKVQW_14840 [Pyrinomonadaceae bacterium]